MPLTRKQRARRAAWTPAQKRRHEKKQVREAELVAYLEKSGWKKGRESWLKPDWDLDKERKYLTKDGKPPEGIEPMTCYASLHKAARIQRKLDAGMGH